MRGGDEGSVATAIACPIAARGDGSSAEPIGQAQDGTESISAETTARTSAGINGGQHAIGASAAAAQCGTIRDGAGADKDD